MSDGSGMHSSAVIVILAADQSGARARGLFWKHEQRFREKKEKKTVFWLCWTAWIIWLLIKPLFVCCLPVRPSEKSDLAKPATVAKRGWSYHTGVIQNTGGYKKKWM